MFSGSFCEERSSKGGGGAAQEEEGGRVYFCSILAKPSLRLFSGQVLKGETCPLCQGILFVRCCSPSHRIPWNKACPCPLIRTGYLSSVVGWGVFFLPARVSDCIPPPGEGGIVYLDRFSNGDDDDDIHGERRESWEKKSRNVRSIRLIGVIIRTQSWSISGEGPVHRHPPSN